jgi:hypothetical protein
MENCDELMTDNNTALAETRSALEKNDLALEASSTLVKRLEERLRSAPCHRGTLDGDTNLLCSATHIQSTAFSITTVYANQAYHWDKTISQISVCVPSTIFPT